MINHPTALPMPIAKRTRSKYAWKRCKNCRKQAIQCPCELTHWTIHAMADLPPGCSSMATVRYPTLNRAFAAIKERMNADRTLLFAIRNACADNAKGNWGSLAAAHDHMTGEWRRPLPHTDGRPLFSQFEWTFTYTNADAALFVNNRVG